MKTAFVFPGQGSQLVGMGKSFYETHVQARNVIDEAEASLDFPLKKLMFEGPIEELTQTDKAQPALFIVSMAIAKCLPPLQPYYMAGHSLGEYTALCAAGALSFKDALDLVSFRGLCMRNASQEGEMAAVLGLESDVIEEALQEGCVIANDNAPGQVIISGSNASVEKTIASLSGAKKVIKLPVSGAFHSPLMQPAQKKMQEKLENVTFMPLKTPVISNVTAQPFQNDIKTLLLQQITGRVRWREIIDYLAVQGIERILEIGSGKVLTGLNRRIAPELVCDYISEPDCLNRVFSSI